MQEKNIQPIVLVMAVVGTLLVAFLIYSRYSGVPRPTLGPGSEPPREIAPGKMTPGPPMPGSGGGGPRMPNGKGR